MLGKEYSGKKLLCYFAKMVILWFFVLLIAILFDCVQKQLIKCEIIVCLYSKLARLFRWFGITYCDISEFQNKTGSIVLTFLGMFISTGLKIVDSSEKIIFGLSRSGLKFKSNDWTQILESDTVNRANFLTPVIMVLTSITNSPITGLWLILWSYGFVICQYRVYSMSLKYSYQRDAVVGYLEKCLKNDNYTKALEQMASYFQQKKEWAIAEDIWNLLLEKVLKSDLDIYYCTRFYYEKIFCCDKELANLQFFRQLLWIESQNNDLGYKSDMVLRGIMDGVIPAFNSMQMYQFLVKFTDFSGRLRQISENKNIELTDDQIEKECLWITILLSVWYKRIRKMESWKEVEILLNKVKLIKKDKLINLLDDCFWHLRGMTETEKHDNDKEMKDIFDFVTLDNSKDCLLHYALDVHI